MRAVWLIAFLGMCNVSQAQLAFSEIELPEGGYSREAVEARIDQFARCWNQTKLPNADFRFIISVDKKGMLNGPVTFKIPPDVKDADAIKKSMEDHLRRCQPYRLVELDKQYSVWEKQQYRVEAFDPAYINAILEDKYFTALWIKLRRCWEPPSSGVVPITLVLKFNSDGTISGPPEVVNPRSDLDFMRSATAALEAFKRCPPHRQVAKDKTFTQHIEFQFNP